MMSTPGTPPPPRRTPPPVAVPVTVDPGTVRVGDQLLIAGQAFTILDMAVLAGGGRRLVFHSGETFTMRPTTVLWATRLITPRTARIRPPRGIGRP
ncbi:hypothetical protein RM780_08030 [Streptomyces sp. DSM 44917]|uniref:IPT/TIG domain-containing protein n=1 Tax=Streptomyces boetiae TaxID=3075541 RepID=A0ABU2L636_9ACTN|nr:hypothetical protein [Streptomyces sp. DSM 44917]MDT0306911.1 hypothetical protein [Streptomyces sp. DSM 44917]